MISTNLIAEVTHNHVKTLRILLVDDNLDFLESTEHFLSLEPYLEVVGYALSGREALEQVQFLKPDLVLMDVAMPEMNGFQATRLLKARPGGPRVVVLSMHDDPVYRTEARAMGADGFVSKGEVGTSLLPLIGILFPAGSALSCASS